jgi:hypothetical protein
MFCDDHFCRDYPVRWRWVKDDPKAKGTLSRRERGRERESTDLLARARILRRQSSDAENLLWRHLRDVV